MKKGKNRRRGIDWRKGGAELISIGLAMPIICMLIIMCVGIMQAGIVRQALEYATYMAARAAVTCDSQSDAVVQAASTAKMTMAGSSFGVDLDQMVVTVELVGGTSSATNGSGISWEKGALAKCRVTVPYRSLTTFTDETMSSAIYMMVEKPAHTYY